jgi:hypothetical protein
LLKLTISPFKWNQIILSDKPRYSKKVMNGKSFSNIGFPLSIICVTNASIGKIDVLISREMARTSGPDATGDHPHVYW